MTRQFPKSALVGIAATVIVVVILFFFTPLPKGGEGRVVPVMQSSGSYEGADKCATCHKRVSPDIVEQYASSEYAWYRGTRLNSSPTRSMSPSSSS